MKFRHLPPGREPGRQTRRDRLLFPVWIAGATVLFGSLFGWLALTNVTDGRFGAGDLWALAPFALLTGLYIELRDRFPARAKRLRLSASPHEVARGGETRATLTIGPAGRRGAERLELGLVCVERYDGRADRHEARWSTWPRTHQEVVYEQWRKVDPGSARHQLHFKIPREPPFSYEGAHVSYAWRLSARELRPRGRDRSADHPIWVLP